MAEYIDRESALKAVKNVWLGVGAINKIPAADVAPVVHGHWVQIGDTDEWECSICRDTIVCHGYTPNTGGKNYCSYCGARMDGETDG